MNGFVVVNGSEGGWEDDTDVCEDDAAEEVSVEEGGRGEEGVVGLGCARKGDCYSERPELFVLSSGEKGISTSLIISRTRRDREGELLLTANQVLSQAGRNTSSFTAR
jgi:hypothetical protein